MGNAHGNGVYTFNDATAGAGSKLELAKVRCDMVRGWLASRLEDEVKRMLN